MIRIGADLLDVHDQILVSGIHDSIVSGINLTAKNTLEVTLAQPQWAEGPELVIRYQSSSQVIAWASGNFLPSIISAAYLSRGPATHEWLSEKLGPLVSEQLAANLLKINPELYVSVLMPLYGDYLCIAAKEQLNLWLL